MADWHMYLPSPIPFNGVPEHAIDLSDHSPVLKHGQCEWCAVYYRARIKEISPKGMGIETVEHLLGGEGDPQLVLADNLAPVLTVTGAEAVLQCDSVHNTCYIMHCNFDAGNGITRN